MADCHEYVLLQPHSDSVIACAFSKDNSPDAGRYLATAGLDMCVHLYDLGSDQFRQLLASPLIDADATRATPTTNADGTAAAHGDDNYVVEVELELLQPDATLELTSEITVPHSHISTYIYIYIY